MKYHFTLSIPVVGYDVTGAENHRVEMRSSKNPLANCYIQFPFAFPSTKETRTALNRQPSSSSSFCQPNTAAQALPPAIFTTFTTP